MDTMIEVFILQQFSAERWQWETAGCYLSLDGAKQGLFLKESWSCGLRKWRIVRKIEEVVWEE